MSEDEPKPDAWDKADADWQDIQESWNELRGPESPITLVTTRASDLQSQLVIVAAKATFELTKYTAKHEGQPVTGAVLADITAKGVEIFMQKWFDHLRSQDLAGLIEVVLEGQQLSPTEMKGFLTALPASLLERIHKSSIGTVTGVHALIAFEMHRRRRGILDYTLSKEGVRTKVEFVHPALGTPVSFYLDEAFEGLPKEGSP